MGLVHITSWYPNFNGSHFGLPPSEIHRMTGLPPKIVWTMTYSHRPHYSNTVQSTSFKHLYIIYFVPAEPTSCEWPINGLQNDLLQRVTDQRVLQLCKRVTWRQHLLCGEGCRPEPRSTPSDCLWENRRKEIRKNKLSCNRRKDIFYIQLFLCVCVVCVSEKDGR